MNIFLRFLQTMIIIVFWTEIVLLNLKDLGDGSMMAMTFFGICYAIFPYILPLGAAYRDIKMFKLQTKREFPGELSYATMISTYFTGVSIALYAIFLIIKWLVVAGYLKGMIPATIIAVAICGIVMILLESLRLVWHRFVDYA